MECDLHSEKGRERKDPEMRNSQQGPEPCWMNPTQLSNI